MSSRIFSSICTIKKSASLISLARFNVKFNKIPLFNIYWDYRHRNILSSAKLNAYNKISFDEVEHDITNYQNLVSVLSAEALADNTDTRF